MKWDWYAQRNPSHSGQTRIKMNEWGQINDFVNLKKKRIHEVFKCIDFFRQYESNGLSKK